MLKFGSTHFKGDVDVPLDAEKFPAEVNWIDAIQPTADEIGFLQDKLGIRHPDAGAPVRDRNLQPALYRSRPSFHVHADDRAPQWRTAENHAARLRAGRDFALTIRFEPMKPCDALHEAKAFESGRGASGANALIMVLESIIDFIADELEK